ncbi:MAG: GTPase Era [Bacilli bacterium]|jgi:GTP-binding protein Era|nr:GTPase Era [Bacilli bacterium]
MIKSGFVTIAGRPNAGKSTLLNTILKEKRAIVTPKPQTTNRNIQGVYNDLRGQIVFIDTPGIHKPKTIYGEHLNKQAYHGIRGSELTLLVVDGSVPYGSGDEYLFQKLKIDHDLIVVLTKIDLANPTDIEVLKTKWQENYPDAPLIEVSSVNNFNVEELITLIFDKLEEGPLYFPEPEDYEVKLEQYINEIVREKIIMLTHEEIPYSVAVTVDHLTKGEKKIEAYLTIYCEKESQKGILIGKGAKMIKRIRLQAQYELSAYLNKDVLLEIMVKVEPMWRSDPKILKKLLGV